MKEATPTQIEDEDIQVKPNLDFHHGELEEQEPKMLG
jgi:hypothetical protein